MATSWKDKEPVTLTIITAHHTFLRLGRGNTNLGGSGGGGSEFVVGFVATCQILTKYFMLKILEFFVHPIILSSLLLLSPLDTLQIPLPQHRSQTLST